MLAACTTPEDRARKLVGDLRDAVVKDDQAAFAHLADANMRSLMDRGHFDKSEAVRWSDEIIAHPVRIVATEQGVAFIGWVEHGRNRKLGQVLVGEADALSCYTALAKGNAQSADRSWRVAIIAMEEWLSAAAANAETRAKVEGALAKIDDATLAKWFFAGDDDAKHTIRAALRSSY